MYVKLCILVLHIGFSFLYGADGDTGKRSNTVTAEDWRRVRETRRVAREKSENLFARRRGLVEPKKQTSPAVERDKGIKEKPYSSTEEGKSDAAEAAERAQKLRAQKRELEQKALEAEQEKQRIEAELRAQEERFIRNTTGWTGMYRAFVFWLTGYDVAAQ